MSESCKRRDARTGFTVEQEQRVQKEAAPRRMRGDYAVLHETVIAKRLAWWQEHHEALHLNGLLPRQAYSLVFLVHGPDAP